MSVVTIDYKIAYEELQAQIVLLTAELKRIQEQLNYYTNARFGRRTEQIQNTSQMTLSDFVNEAEATADFVIPEETFPEATEEIRYTRKKTKGKRDKDLRGLPTEQILLELESEICPKCDVEMTLIGQDVIVSVKPSPYKKQTIRSAKSCKIIILHSLAMCHSKVKIVEFLLLCNLC